MSGYMPHIKYETKFESDKVVVTCDPLTQDALFSMLPKLQRFQGMTGVTKETTDEKLMQHPEAVQELYAAAKECLATHNVVIEGLTDNANNPIRTEEVMERAYFMPLVLEIFSNLMESASLGKLASASLELK